MYNNSLRNSLNSSLGGSPILSPVSGPMACSACGPTMLGYGPMHGRLGMSGSDAGCVIKLFKMMPKDDDKYSLDVIGTYSGYDGQDAWNKLASAGPALTPTAAVTTNITVGGWEYCNAGTVKISSGSLNARKRPAPDAGTGPGTGKNSSWGGKSAPPPFSEWAVVKRYNNGDKLTIKNESMRDDGSDHRYTLADDTQVSADFVTCDGKGKAATRKQPVQQVPQYGLLIAYPQRQQVNVIFPLNEISAYAPRGSKNIVFPAKRPLFPPSEDCNVSGKFRSAKSRKGHGGIGGNAAARVAVFATSFSRQSTPSTIQAQEAQGFTILNTALGAAATEALNGCSSGLPSPTDLLSVIGGVVSTVVDTGAGTPVDAGTGTGGAATDAGGYSDASAEQASSGGGSTGLILGAVGAVAALYFITKG